MKCWGHAQMRWEEPCCLRPEVTPLWHCSLFIDTDKVCVGKIMLKTFTFAGLVLFSWYRWYTRLTNTVNKRGTNKWKIELKFTGGYIVPGWWWASQTTQGGGGLSCGLKADIYNTSTLKSLLFFGKYSCQTKRCLEIFSVTRNGQQCVLRPLTVSNMKIFTRSI